MKHFVKEKEENSIKIVFFIALSILTLSGVFLLMYEYWVIPHYWKNRWRFNRLLNKNMVKIKLIGKPTENISAYLVTIEDSEYSLWVYNSNSMTLDNVDNSDYADYIGLFAGSLITRHLNKLAIKKIQKILKDNE
jgi:hypothetical protein